MLSIIYGISSALSWGAGDFAGGLATRKLGAYRAVFYADFLGLLALLVVIVFLPEKIPSVSSLVIAGVGGMLGPWLIGLAGDALGLSLGFGINLLYCGLLLVIMLMLIKETKHDGKDA